MAIFYTFLTTFSNRSVKWENWERSKASQQKQTEFYKKKLFLENMGKAEKGSN